MANNSNVIDIMENENCSEEIATLLRVALDMGSIKFSILQKFANTNYDQYDLMKMFDDKGIHVKFN